MDGLQSDARLAERTLYDTGLDYLAHISAHVHTKLNDPGKHPRCLCRFIMCTLVNLKSAILGIHWIRPPTSVLGLQMF